MISPTTAASIVAIAEIVTTFFRGDPHVQLLGRKLVEFISKVQQAVRLRLMFMFYLHYKLNRDLVLLTGLIFALIGYYIAITWKPVSESCDLDPQIKFYFVAKIN